MARIGCDTEGRPRTEYRNRVRGKSSRKRRATSGRGPSRSLDTTRTRYRSTYIMVQSRILDQGRPGLARGCIATELPSGLAGLGWLRSCGTVGGGMVNFWMLHIPDASAGKPEWPGDGPCHRQGREIGRRLLAAPIFRPVASDLAACSFCGPTPEASSGLIFLELNGTGRHQKQAGFWSRWLQRPNQTVLWNNA